MKLSAPKKNTFWIALVIAIIAVVASFVSIPVLTINAFWVLLIAFVLLLLGTFIKGF